MDRAERVGAFGLLRDWRDGLAVSGFAYLLREKAWLSSSWERRGRRRRQGPAIAAQRQVSLHLP